ncbi:MAG: hypothetical protein JW822_13935 [Spirochaetales bacterium]|nr:hypothetical protein [Spirochaetales bacterium]
MIDAYSFGQIKVDGRTYRSDVIIYPEKINSFWWRKEGHNLGLDDLKEVIDYRPEMLIIGQGKLGVMKVRPEVRRQMLKKGIHLFIARTTQAVQKYNELAHTKKVVAALHLTC